MSRNVAWRRQLSDAASWHQDEALNATVYILREMGPTGFLLKEEGEAKKYKVYLGDPHSCTCHTFLKERDLCKHICWVLLRKFRIPRQNELTWQLGLVEREVNDLLRGRMVQKEPAASSQQRTQDTSGVGVDGDDNEAAIQQRPIADDDVCPICQEEFFAKHLPVTYCKLGCGNSIHIKCMKVWAEHQKTQGETNIKCPLCREDFGSFSLLQQEMRNSSMRNTRAERLGQHLGATCKKCRVAPIVGKCYKCTVCVEYHLCQNCFITSVHGHHNFDFREKPSQRWRTAQRGTGAALPPAVVSAMMDRDLGNADYEVLLQLDNQAALTPSDLSEETVKSLPTERIRKNGLLMAPGQQCRVCLQRYSEGQYVRKLPCRHKFHKDCIDNWLLHQHATCPVDGTVFTNESVRAYKEAEKIRLQQRRLNNTDDNSKTKASSGEELALEIPGIGICSLQQNHRNGTLRSGHLPTAPTFLEDAAGILISGSSYTKAHSEPSTPAALRRHPPPKTSPLVPIPPSIPKPHNVSKLCIGEQPIESTQHRPPSGNHRNHVKSAGSLRGRNPHQEKRNKSTNRPRQLERTASNPNLYIGNREQELLLSESGIQCTGSDPSLIQQNHSKSELLLHREGAGSSSSPQNEGSGGMVQQLQRGSANANSTGSGELCIGTGAITTKQSGSSLVGSGKSLRQGLPSSLGPREATNLRPQGYTAGSNALYVGSNPASSETCIRQFLLNTIKQKSGVKRGATTSQNTRKETGDRHWGEVREMTGDSNTMMLCGSRVHSDDS